MAVALVPPNVNVPIGDCVLHRTEILVLMRAIRIAAETDIRPDIAIEPGQFLGNDVPKLKLTDARRIDQVTTTRQRNELCRRGRVPPLLVFSTDLLDSEVQSWFDGIQQGGFPDATLSSYHAGPPENLPPQSLHARRRSHSQAAVPTGESTSA